MPSYHFDDTEMMQVAKAIRKYNKHTDGFTDHGLVSFMESLAMKELTKPSYISTYGFVLTAFWYPGKDDCLGIKASVSASILQ